MTAESTDGKDRPFVHPFLQVGGMFIGEILCLITFYISNCFKSTQNENENGQTMSYNLLIFWPPAILDMVSTSMQYIGLTLTYASSFQMLRGSVIVFTGLLSIILLRTKLEINRWVGILIVTCGLVTVGISDVLNQNNSNHLTLNENHNLQMVGDIMIITAQIIVALQMVYEEKFITKYNIAPLKAVGFEGLFGFLTLVILLVPFYFIYVGPTIGHNPRMVLEDAYDGFYQLAHNSQLSIAFFSTMVSLM